MKTFKNTLTFGFFYLNNDNNNHTKKTIYTCIEFIRNYNFPKYF